MTVQNNTRSIVLDDPLSNGSYSGERTVFTSCNKPYQITRTDRIYVMRQTLSNEPVSPYSNSLSRDIEESPHGRKNYYSLYTNINTSLPPFQEKIVKLKNKKQTVFHKIGSTITTAKHFLRLHVFAGCVHPRRHLHFQQYRCLSALSNARTSVCFLSTGPKKNFAILPANWLGSIHH